MSGGTVGEHKDAYDGWDFPLKAGQDHYPVTTSPIDTLIVKATGKTNPVVLLILAASEDVRHDVDLLAKAPSFSY